MARIITRDDTVTIDVSKVTDDPESPTLAEMPIRRRILIEDDGSEYDITTLDGRE